MRKTTLLQRLLVLPMVLFANFMVFPQSGKKLFNSLDKLKAGEWYEVTNSHLEDVDAQNDSTANPNYPGGAPWQGVEGVAAVINDWSGGAFDTKGNRLLVWGGGHAGYAGNEIYAFNIDSLKWLRLTNRGNASKFLKSSVNTHYPNRHQGVSL